MNAKPLPILRAPIRWFFPCLSRGLAALLLLATFHAQAFSLLGPFADWMDVTKGYRDGNTIGGPMNIGEGYRWNVPVITYGFDRSFLGYFGTNGAAEVDAAIAILNQVPAASSGGWQDCPLQVWRSNHEAEFLYLQDLKTKALGLLLEQVGLTDPVRYVFCVRDYFLLGPDPLFDCSFYIVRRNFDPQNAQPSPYVNSIPFSYQIPTFPPISPDRTFCWAEPFMVDPTASCLLTAAARYYLPYCNFGAYLVGLSPDDVGGLQYLLNPNQVRWENLLPDVRLPARSGGTLVRTALRPGLDKLTFVRHPAGSLNGEFLPFTNQWTDVYLDFDAFGFQAVERVTTRPDILFTAADLGPLTDASRTGTSNWVNHAELNGNYGGAGPGVIQPPITITFNSAAPFRVTSTSSPTGTDSLPMLTWGSFNGTSQTPFVYPVARGPFQSSELRLRLLVGGGSREFRWSLGGPAYARFQLQTSTDLSEWHSLLLLTNTGSPVTCEFRVEPQEPARFFRTLRQ